MQTMLLLLFLSLLVATVRGGCTGSPKMMNGLRCATTTRYWDGQMGACGCGSGNTPFSWQYTDYTAAASQAIFDANGASWCGAGCGSCWELTPTGDCPTGGPCASSTAPITVMVTNLCPYNGNQQWCPNPGATNQYGYSQHFDLMDQNMNGKISALGWNNPVVTYRQVPCGNEGSPSCSNAGGCQCATSSQCSASGGSAATTHATSSTTHATTAAATTTHATSSTTHSTSTTASSSGGACTGTASVSNSGGSGTITIHNSGSGTIKTAQVTLTGTITSSYNLNSLGSGKYSFPSWLAISPGSSYTSSGYQYSGSAPSITLNSVGC